MREGLAKRCAAQVYVRDTYRVNRSGRGAHFTMHYARQQCGRYIQGEDKYCWQHKLFRPYGDYR